MFVALALLLLAGGGSTSTAGKEKPAFLKIRGTNVHAARVSVPSVGGALLYAYILGRTRMDDKA